MQLAFGAVALNRVAMRRGVQQPFTVYDPVGSITVQSIGRPLVVSVQTTRPGRITKRVERTGFGVSVWLWA